MTPDPTTILLEDLRWLRALARRLTSDSHLADDAVQATASIALAQGRAGSPQAPRAWLATVLRHWLGRHGRREQARNRRERDGRTGPETAPDSSDTLQRAETQHRLAAAVLQLGEPYRSTVLMRFFDGLPPRRIAQQLGVPVATVHSRLQRALQQLRAELDDGPGGRSHWLAALTPATGLAPFAPLAATPLLLLPMKFKLLTAVAALLACSSPWWWPSTTDAGATSPEANVGVPQPRHGGATGSSGAAPSSNQAQDERTLVSAATDERATAPTFRVGGRTLDCRGDAVADVLVTPNGNADRAVRSDHTGSFVLELSGNTMITADDERFVTVLSATWSQTAAIAPVVIVAPAVAIGGRVVDEFGAAIAAAQVVLQLPEDFDARFPVPLDRAGRQRWQTTSAADGSFAWSRLPRIDGAELLAAAELFAPTHVPLPDRDDDALQLVLHGFHFEAGELQGHVIDARGEPVAAARVAMGVTSVLTDRDGRFSLSLRRAGWPTAIVAAKPGHGPGRCELPRNGGKQVTDWPTDIELVLGTAPRSVRGRVHDAEQRPIAGAEVWIDDPTPFGIVGAVPLQLEYFVAGGHVPLKATMAPAPHADDPTAENNAYTRMGKPNSATAMWFYVTTDDHGRFELPGLLDRDYRIKALDPATGLLSERQVASGETSVDLEIRREGLWPELRGTVVSLGGAPIAGVSVQQRFTVFDTRARIPGGSFRGGALRDGMATVSDAEGHFVLQNVGTAGSHFEFSGDGIVPTQLEAKQIADPTNCVIKVEARCHVEVSLVDAGEADEVVAFDREGKQAMLAVLRHNSSTFTTSLPLHAGRSGLFVVGESVASLALLRGGVKVRTITIQPVVGRTTTVQ